MEQSKHNIVSSLDVSTADICFCKPHESTYGQKIFINSPIEAKDAIKQLEWERTHRRWQPAVSMWEIDFDGVAYAIIELSDHGYSIEVTEACVDELANRL